MGYLENNLIERNKINDSLFLYKYVIGTKTRNIHIYTGKLSAETKQLLELKNDTITLPISDVESFMSGHVAALEKKGYSLSSMQLTDYSSKGNSLSATLKASTEKKRTLNNIVIEGYTKFPEGIRKNITRQYKGKTFNQENLQRIYNDFSALRFVNQIRYPEILFKQDTTKVYVYLEKAKPNTFDGFIGFSNDDQNKVIFNGYLDLLLNNVLNTGEKFNLFWKSDGNKQTTFNAALELPYIFRSPIGLKGSLKIFKQDSTFQNTATDINIGYYFSYNSKLFVGLQQTQSVDIQNLNNSSLSDFNNSFVTSTFDFTDYNLDDFIFPEKTIALIKAGTGKRTSKTGNSDQYFIQANFSHNLYLNKQNLINLKTQDYYLKSNTYIINELFRFGGINSIRGFNENSLQANLLLSLMAEYRYILSPNMYVHSITDYAYFEDETSKTQNNLLGLGFGFGLLTKTGLFNIIYANGSSNNQQIKLSNSIIHISFRTRF
ncbi:outer membrane translocation and assembly module TamA [Flavobacterium sp. AG291]|nr:outer membrane translocation and assembly module TamA [Flavobacterium sp. AG291]